jgi:hypothetical protein
VASSSSNVTKSAEGKYAVAEMDAVELAIQEAYDESNSYSPINNESCLSVENDSVLSSCIILLEVDNLK